MAAEHPSREDADRALRLVADLVTATDAALLAAALDVVWTATRDLGRSPQRSA